AGSISSGCISWQNRLAAPGKNEGRAMSDPSKRRAEQAFRAAFRVAPQVAREIVAGARLGIYGWQTPDFEGFELPESDELVLALHLGGSRRVRAVTDHDLSRSQSTPGMVTI